MRNNYLTNNKAEKRNKKIAKKISRAVKHCGDNLQIFGEPIIFNPENISIGDNVKLNLNAFLNARSGITIGNNVTVSHGAKIVSTGYDLDLWAETGQRVHKTDTPIFIGNNCWICMDAIILPNVKITGEFVVVGAGAVVTKDITESYVIVAGNPARVVKHLKHENN